MTNLNFNSRIFNYMKNNGVNLKKAKEEIAKEQSNESDTNHQSQSAEQKFDNAASMSQLDYAALANSFIVNNKIIKDSNATVYTFTNNKAQTIMINGQAVKITVTGASVKKTLQLTVDKEGKINIENAGASAIKFETNADLKINVESSLSNLAITGGSGNDIITVEDGAKISKIDSGQGNDVIVNKGFQNASATLTGGEGDDTIFNFSTISSMDGGKGDDLMVNLVNASSKKIVGGDDNDTLLNFGDTTSIDAGKGDDTIVNNGTDNANTAIVGGDGNDVILNSVVAKSIDAGKGDDAVKNTAENLKMTIKGGDGNDNITNTAAISSIDAGNGNNTINNSGSNEKMTIKSGTGSDTIINTGSIASIAAGNGDNIIKNSGSNEKMKITTGSGNDTITNTGDIASIDAGSGIADTIIGKGTVTNVENIDEHFNGVANKKLYVDGQLAQKEQSDGKYYKDGVLFTGTIVVNGTYYTYSKGLLTKKIENNDGIQITTQNTYNSNNDITKQTIIETQNNTTKTTTITNTYDKKTNRLTQEYVVISNKVGNKTTKSDQTTFYTYTDTEDGFTLRNGKVYSGKKAEESKFIKDSPEYVLKDGVLYDGEYHNKMYAGGRPFTGRDASGIRYQDGDKYSGYDKEEDKYYNDGIWADDVIVDGKYCINGNPANGFYDIKQENGEKITTLFEEGIKYTGEHFTQDGTRKLMFSEGIIAHEVEVKGLMYSEGVVADKVTIKGLYYREGKTYTGVEDDGQEYIEGKKIVAFDLSQTGTNCDGIISVNNKDVIVNYNKTAPNGSLKIKVDSDGIIHVYAKNVTDIDFSNTKNVNDLNIVVEESNSSMNITGSLYGNDKITIKSGVTVGNVDGSNGDDTITIEEGAIVKGTINGGDGKDTLSGSMVDPTIENFEKYENVSNITYNLTDSGTYCSKTIIVNDKPVNVHYNKTAGDAKLRIEVDNDGIIHVYAKNVNDIDFLNTENANDLNIVVEESNSSMNITGSLYGNDKITIKSGVTVGNVDGSFGDDTITIEEGAIVKGTINGGGGEDTLSGSMVDPTIEDFEKYENVSNITYNLTDSGTYCSKTIIVNDKPVNVHYNKTAGDAKLRIEVDNDGIMHVYAKNVNDINFSDNANDLNIVVEESNSPLNITGSFWGNDKITIKSGVTVGNVDGSFGDDTIIIEKGAIVKGTINGGDGDGDILINKANISTSQIENFKTIKRS